MGHVLLSTTILASFLGGIVALFAPCCVSVMLPAFFASTFQKRRRILAMTFVFAAGVGTIILPIAFGAAVVSRVLVRYHLWIFTIVGVAMLAGGVAVLGGWKMMLPMPSGRAAASGGAGSVYTLGVFSGTASACCAPVLAGVAALSGAASSLPAAAAVGVAYVFGMVAPLCALALVWDRKDWGATRILSGRPMRLWPGAHQRLPPATVISGLLMVAMGVLTVVIALRGPGMPTDGWQVQVTAFLNHAASVTVRAVSFVPGWLLTAAVFAALGALAWRAVARHGGPRRAAADPTSADRPHVAAVIDIADGPSPTQHMGPAQHMGKVE